jgi:hypothetical protein
MEYEKAKKTRLNSKTIESSKSQQKNLRKESLLFFKSKERLD